MSKRRQVWRNVLDDEELVTPDKVGNADVLLKGVDVSVSEDADKVDEDVSDSADVVGDAVSSAGPGSKPERGRLGNEGRDTVGNTSPRAGRPAVRPAGKPAAVGAAVSEVKVSTLVTAPVASM